MRSDCTSCFTDIHSWWCVRCLVKRTACCDHVVVVCDGSWLHQTSPVVWLQWSFSCPLRRWPSRSTVWSGLFQRSQRVVCHHHIQLKHEQQHKHKHIVLSVTCFSAQNDCTSWLTTRLAAVVAKQCIAGHRTYGEFEIIIYVVKYQSICESW